MPTGSFNFVRLVNWVTIGAYLAVVSLGDCHLQEIGEGGRGAGRASVGMCWNRGGKGLVSGKL